MTVNLKNPYYDSYKSTYFLPKCRLCGEQGCKNCPLPLNAHQTLGELMDSIVSKVSFGDNTYLYRMNKEDLKKKQESIEKGENIVTGNTTAGDEEGKGEVKPKKKKNLGLIQSSSDEDEDDDNLFSDTKNKALKDKTSGENLARHLTF